MPPDDEYAAALRFLYGRINYEQAARIPYRSRELNLSQMRNLLERIDNPHDRLPIVHIAGTKGKGSTAAMISSVLVAAGYRVGLYTSPHLTRLEERFAVNGEACSPQELVDLTNSLQEVVLQMDDDTQSGYRATFFEITTAMALLHFVRRQVEIAVLEVGMGGRLDSTNVCLPMLSVITSISFDHTKQLGNTLAAIAGEKAGIIKPGVPVISGVVKQEPADVIGRIAHERGCRLYRRDRDFHATFHQAPEAGEGRITYRESPDVSDWKLVDAPLGMLGRHQAANASVALATLNRLREMNWGIHDDACRRGLQSALCPARIEVVSQRPAVVLDTAHNAASIEALTATLAESFPSGPRRLIFAVARDKDVTGMLRQLLPHFDHVYLTQFTSNPRSMQLSTLTELANTVREELPQKQVTLHSAATPEEAWEKCRAAAEPDAIVCITGSFFLASELRFAVQATPILKEPTMSNANRPRVFVTRRIPAAGLERVVRECDAELWTEPLPPPRNVLLQKIAGCEGVLSLLTEKIDVEFFDAAGPQLKVISNFAVGYNNIDIEEATRRGIRVGNTPDVLTDATADMAFSLLISAARRIVEGQDYIREKRWKTWEPLGFIGVDLIGRTIGIVGMGRIGFAMAKRCRGGWGMQVLYHDKYRHEAAEKELGARQVDFDTLLAQSDFVSVHTDLNEASKGMFNAAAFRQMKPTAVFVNSARGPIHNQRDLYDALKNKFIFAAGLDVTDPEPIPLDDPLLTLPNCVIAPHIASATISSRNGMAEIAADNLLAGLRGQPLRCWVNKP